MSYFIFNNILYKQIDVVAMGSPLGPSLANVFLAHHEFIYLFIYLFTLSFLKIGSRVALWNINRHIIDGMLMKNSYFPNHLITF